MYNRKIYNRFDYFSFIRNEKEGGEGDEENDRINVEPEGTVLF